MCNCLAGEEVVKLITKDSVVVLRWRKFSLSGVYMVNV
jgi:hypothetical protein